MRISSLATKPINLGFQQYQLSKSLISFIDPPSNEQSLKLILAKSPTTFAASAVESETPPVVDLETAAAHLSSTP